MDYEVNVDNNYSIRVEVTDDRGGVFARELTVPVGNDDSEDNDKDGLSEKRETELGLNDFDPDFDKDGHADGIEVENGTDPKDPYDPRPPNDIPVELMLNSKSIVENKPIGSRIGSFETFDPNPWDKQFSYQLVDGNGSDDNDLFEVDENGTLLNRVVFDFEKQARAKIRVRSTDEAGGYLEKTFVIIILDNANEDEDNDGLSELEEEGYGTSDQLADTDGDQFSDLIEINDGTDPLDPEDYPKSNSAPVSISLNPRKILENSPFYTVVGNFEVIDPDESDSHTFSL